MSGVLEMKQAKNELKRKLVEENEINVAETEKKKRV